MFKTIDFSDSGLTLLKKASNLPKVEIQRNFVKTTPYPAQLNMPLSKEDWNIIVTEKTQWPYSKPYEYHYLNRSYYKNNIYAITYSRLFISGNNSNDINEIVMTLLNSNGKLISSFIIRGNHGDNLDFSSSINSKYEIKRETNKYKINPKTKKYERYSSIKKFKINENGYISVVK
ncbi:hypothetical protein E5K00_21880 [Hymenobacter aquaticus]|uniref:Uncharacterized protein n=1 Tax=Hymenobacter aquaticus TaxID=1867101 RepID=A0A4Z0PTL1_9BACT|nr:hypothetical protein [Hymenobacter aquaticus]TGE20646.1 hypothetical protein E5K00_21880 [Hymenobacter aquaticus]